jgi:hypothetical protein
MPHVPRPIVAAHVKIDSGRFGNSKMQALLSKTKFALSLCAFEKNNSSFLNATEKSPNSSTQILPIKMSEENVTRKFLASAPRGPLSFHFRC